MATTSLSLPRPGRKSFFGDHPEFACRIGGPCLEPYLYDGDLVHFIRREPHPGDIVACEFDGQPCIKQFLGKNISGEVRLHMTNPGPGH